MPRDDSSSAVVVFADAAVEIEEGVDTDCEIAEDILDILGAPEEIVADVAWAAEEDIPVDAVVAAGILRMVVVTALVDVVVVVVEGNSEDFAQEERHRMAGEVED